jgi:hypothetical protein
MINKVDQLRGQPYGLLGFIKLHVERGIPGESSNDDNASHGNGCDAMNDARAPGNAGGLSLSRLPIEHVVAEPRWKTSSNELVLST